MAKRAAPRTLGAKESYTGKEFRPYALAIGQAALAWNGLHEALAMLFWTLLGGGFIDTAAGVWNSAGFDRARRGMVRGALDGTTERARIQHPKMMSDIKFLLDRADELENARNDVVHTPLYRLHRWGGMIPRTAETALPDVIFRNARALNIAKKQDILAEFRWCRKQGAALRQYAMRLDRALTSQGAAWPKRPILPNRGHKKSQSHVKRRDANESRPRPLQAPRS
jgi:hypothetical protein